MMDRNTQWASMAAGIFLLLYGLWKLYQEGDWTLVILGGLIIGFTISSIVKARQKE